MPEQVDVIKVLRCMAVGVIRAQNKCTGIETIIDFLDVLKRRCKRPAPKILKSRIPAQECPNTPPCLDFAERAECDDLEEAIYRLYRLGAACNLSDPILRDTVNSPIDGAKPESMSDYIVNPKPRRTFGSTID